MHVKYGVYIPNIMLSKELDGRRLIHYFLFQAAARMADHLVAYSIPSLFAIPTTILSSSERSSFLI